MSSGDADTDRDRALLGECFELAARARGATSPNPMVGAVVARDGEVIARAFHARAGEAHAEHAALGLAGDAARGATLYVNIEPCAHHGHTPPCVDAIEAAGIKRVVASIRDPDRRVNGAGFAHLRAAGIAVDVGLRARSAALLNAAYLRVKRDGRPLVVAKAALSLDGRLAARDGSSQWITGSEARRQGHELRAASDLVLVGIGTLLRDDPRLSARGVAGGGPRYRGVVDSRLRTPTQARLLHCEGGEPLVLTTESAAAADRARLEAAGGRVVAVAATDQGRVDLRAALAAVLESGVSQVMIEGGGELLTSALELGIIDRVTLFYGPLLIGGREAPTLWGGTGSGSIHDSLRLRSVSLRQLDSDWMVDGWLQPPAELAEPRA